MQFENPINIKLYIPGDKEPTKRISGVPSNITQYQMIDWIRDCGLDEEIKVELIKKVKNYPTNTMGNFYKNLHKHVDNILKKRKRNSDE